MGDNLERLPIFTKAGGWSFVRVWDAITELLAVRERGVHFELARTAVRKGQSRVIDWEGASLGLQEGEILIRIRELAARQRLSRATMTRVLESLARKRVVQVLKKSRGAGGGMILYVCNPDDVPELICRRIMKLSQLRDALTTQDNWESNPELKEKWANLSQSLSQLRTALPKRYQLDFFDNPQSSGPNSGTPEVLNPKTVFNQEVKAALEALDAILEGSGTAGKGEVLER